MGPVEKTLPNSHVLYYDQGRTVRLSDSYWVRGSQGSSVCSIGHVVSEESRTPAHTYKLDDEFASVAECVLTAAHDADYHIYKASPSLRLKKFSRELTSHQRWLLLSYHSMSRFRMRSPSLSEVLL